jgi:glucose-6-phosphate isomerase
MTDWKRPTFVLTIFLTGGSAAEAWKAEYKCAAISTRKRKYKKNQEEEKSFKAWSWVEARLVF